MNKTQPKKREPVRLYSLILLAAAAAVWTANCIVLAVFQRQAAGLKGLLVLDVICAVMVGRLCGKPAALPPGPVGIPRGLAAGGVMGFEGKKRIEKRIPPDRSIRRSFFALSPFDLF